MSPPTTNGENPSNSSSDERPRVGDQNGFGGQADGEKYAVYNLTPNMWEEPWVRYLLSDLPTSRHDIRDLWSPPPEHLRRRRLSMLLESLLPGPLRPTRRMVRRILAPHDFTVVVYNTWGLDPAVRNEVGRLLSRFDRVGIVSVDEPTRDPRETYEKVGFAVRIGFDAEKYRGTQNLLVAPLGVPKNFVPVRSSNGITERKFSWSFLGEVKNPSRRDMVDRLERVRGDRFVHPISTWNADDSRRGTGYSSILAESVFVPSPPANVHLECYRTYEALECDAIPVVDTDYYCEAFCAPFPIVRPDWEDAPETLNSLLDDAGSLERLHEQCRLWWTAVKRDYPRKIGTLARAHAMR
jgi:hypothetical protein